MSGMLILQFLFLMVIVTGTIIFVLHRILIASTDGAVKRLNTETDSVRSKQSELNKKIKEADEELARRKKEAEDLVRKLKEEAEEAARAERERLIKKAREEGEEIIAKAQRTREQMRSEIEKEMELKAVDHSVEILAQVLSEKGKGILDKELISEFVDGLEKMNMDQVDLAADTAEVVTAEPLSDALKERFVKVLKSKLNRAVKIHSTVDPSIVAGVVLRFGSLVLDGSLQNTLRESATGIKQKIERQ